MNFNILEKEYADFSVRLKDFPNSFQIKDHEILQPSSITKLKNGLESALRVGYDTPLETARARNLLAFAFFRQGEPAQALAELEQALQADAKSRNIVSMANKAAILCMTGKHYAANVQVSLLEALKEEDEDFEYLVTKAKAELAFSYSRLGYTYFSIAETLFEEVIPKAREPEKWLWTFGLALTLRRHSHLHLAPMAGASASSTDRSLRILRLLQDVINNSQSLEAKAYAEMGILLNNNRDNSPMLAAAGMDAVGACRKALMLDNKHNSVLCKCAKIFRYVRVDLARSRKLLETAISYRPTSTAYHHLGLTLKAMATVLKYQSQGATNPKRTYSGRESRSGNRGHSRGKPMRWRDYSFKEDELPIQNGIERQEEECQSYRGQYQSETVRGHPQRGKGQHYRGNRESERRTFTSEREIWQPERENISHEKRENYLTVDNVRRGGLQRGRGGQHLNYHGLVKHGRTLLTGDETCGLKGTGSDRQHPISDADLRADARGRGHHYQTHAGSYSQLLHNTQSGRTKVQSPTTESPHDSHEKDLSSPDRMGELGHHAFPHDTTQSPRLESEPPNSSTVHRSLEFSQADGKFRSLHTSDVTGMVDNYRVHTSYLQEATSTKQIVNNLRKTVKSPRKQTEFTRADKYVPEIIECYQKAMTLSERENTRAMYDLAMFYKSLSEFDKALELFEELRIEGTLPVDRINAFEQSGLIYLDKIKYETSNKEKMLLQKEGDSMLNFALSLASRHFSSIPQFQDHIGEIWQAFSTLDKGLDRCDLTEECILMEKARLLQVIKKPQESMEFLQTLEQISPAAVQNPEYIRMRLECYNAQNDFERAVTFISLQSEQIRKEVKKLFKDDQYMLKMYYEASRQVLLQNPEKVSLAQEYFRFAFEETFENSLLPVCSSEDTDDTDSSSHRDFEMNHVMFIHDYKTKSEMTNARKLACLIRHVCGLRTSWSCEDCTPGLETNAALRQIKKSHLVVVIAGSDKLSSEFRMCITNAVQSRPTVTLLLDGTHVPKAMRRRPVKQCPQVILDMDLDDYGMQTLDRVDAICNVFKFLVDIKTNDTEP